MLLHWQLLRTVKVVKIVQLASKPVQLYQRTGGGYKVWDHDVDDISHPLCELMAGWWHADGMLVAC